ncbi:NUDIX domain-containing protein [Phyllobacterium sp. LjRoot231]|uniref:NUDIX domain-containing protein n=1 Tax=Phyllobacterium sp. LjRoot231 TaxID=3342289 RepID=UPI003ECC2911
MVLNPDQFFHTVASHQIPRIRIAGIVVDGDSVLVQQPTDDPHSCYAFIGGEYEIGDTFESRLRKEFEEETNSRIIECRYLVPFLRREPLPTLRQHYPAGGTFLSGKIRSA